MVKVVSVVGARPQFIKASPVSNALRQADHQEFIIHTGQHYDYEMSRVFFDEMELPEPDVNLEVGSGSHAKQTGEMLIQIENILIAEKPDWALVYGDTNSTLAGALAAVKLHIPVAHVEAGLRSFNREMPEEHNRVLTDHISDLLFCPTKTAVGNLINEGFKNIAGDGNLIESTNSRSLDSFPLILDPYSSPLIANVGDVMYDSILHNIKLAERNSRVLDRLKIKPKNYVLATVHRAENTDYPERLMSIFEAFTQIAQDDIPVIIPLHPRTRQCLSNSKFKIDGFVKTPSPLMGEGRGEGEGGGEKTPLRIIDPVSYLDMLMLEQNANAILTDSGGMQKEAYFLGVPCVTLRTETEWVETVETGWNVIAGADRGKIVEAVRCFKSGSPRPELYGDGRASQKIVEILTMLTC
ncbi:MAG: UDP-N-acetyl glucosamine 2-epimerase [Syntrophobacterales bacterium]|nr:UDP-N-acetyl glucosamine 2-epimerase [Syntrophobacterales bacterium]